jgi:fructokinase
VTRLDLKHKDLKHKDLKQESIRIGIDLGGTKIEGVLLDSTGDIKRRERFPTPQEDYPGILEAISALIAMLTDDKHMPIGIGTPGSVSPLTPVMRNSNSTCLNGKHLLADLEQYLGRAVRLANDADCFALSEASDGAGINSPVVFGVILGTGVGGGIVVDGKLVQGPSGVSGEWGHNPMPEVEDLKRGRVCFCGRLDCIETWISGPGLAKSYEGRAGKTLSAREIAALDASGEAMAGQVLDGYFEQLAAALAGVINILDPATIVLGGGVSNIERLYQEVPARLGKYVFSDHVGTRIVKAQHGDSSGVRGAAWLWP